jgi:hypothetical protein
MFHRTLFKYVQSIEPVTKGGKERYVFIKPEVQYIIAEYIRLEFINETAHPSVELSTYEYASLLTSIKDIINGKSSENLTNLLLKYQFKSSHLYCEIDDICLDSLAYLQSYNYCWTVDNEAPSTDKDIMRCYVDDVIDFVNDDSIQLTKENLEQYLVGSRRMLRHKSLFELLKKGGVFEGVKDNKLTENAIYIVREYCRILLHEHGFQNRKWDELVNSFAALVGKIYKNNHDLTNQELSSVIETHQAEVSSYYIEKHEDLLVSFTQGNVVNIEENLNNSANNIFDSEDSNRNQVDTYIDCAIESKG